jgi:hypothetical protein
MASAASLVARACRHMNQAEPHQLLMQQCMTQLMSQPDSSQTRAVGHIHIRYRCTTATIRPHASGSVTRLPTLQQKSHHPPQNARSKLICRT